MTVLILFFYLVQSEMINLQNYIFQALAKQQLLHQPAYAMARGGRSGLRIRVTPWDKKSLWQILRSIQPWRKISLSVCRLWDMMVKNIKPAPVQVEFLEIESLPVFYIIFDILAESLPWVNTSILPMQYGPPAWGWKGLSNNWCGPHRDLENIQGG